jgi:glycosyltransferase 2 family protein
MRQYLLIAGKIAISLALLFFAFSRINFSAVSLRFTQFDMGWIFVATLIAILQVALTAVRWRRIAMACGASLPMREALRFNMIAAFFSQVLPSTVGGDAARIFLLARAGAGWRIATNSVLLDRFVGVLMLAALVVAAQYWSFGLITDTVARFVLFLIGAGNIFGAVLFMLLGSWRLLQRWKLTRYLSELSLLARQILTSRKGRSEILILSLIVHIMTVAIAWSLARAAAAQLGFLDAFLLVLPVMLIATIPLSIGGWGVRETALMLAFSYAGLPESDGLIVSVLLGGVMFAVGLIGGGIWLLSPEGIRLKSGQHFG